MLSTKKRGCVILMKKEQLHLLVEMFKFLISTNRSMASKEVKHINSIPNIILRTGMQM